MSDVQVYFCLFSHIKFNLLFRRSDKPKIEQKPYTSISWKPKVAPMGLPVAEVADTESTEKVVETAPIENGWSIAIILF